MLPVAGYRGIDALVPHGTVTLRQYMAAAMLISNRHVNSCTVCILGFFIARS